MTLITMKSANVVLRFLLEMCVLVAISYWGFHSGRGLIIKVGLGIGLPLLAAIIWGIFGAPKSSMALHGSSHFFLELLLFGAATMALWKANRPTLAMLFGVIVIVNRVLMYLWKQ